MGNNLPLLHSSRMAIGPIQLLQQATPGQRRTLLAASLGWMLDSFDAMLYALVLAHVMHDLDLSAGHNWGTPAPLTAIAPPSLAQASGRLDNVVAAAQYSS